MTPLDAFPWYPQLKLYFGFGLYLGVVSGDRWNSGKSNRTLYQRHLSKSIVALIALLCQLPIHADEIK
jgi:hypothetical protein